MEGRNELAAVTCTRSFLPIEIVLIKDSESAVYLGCDLIRPVVSMF